MVIRTAFKRYFLALFAMLGLAAAGARAEGFDPSVLSPASVFVQAGFAEEQTRAYVLGLTWDWNWQKQFSWLIASGYFEADAGRWITDRNGVSGSAWATQIGLTPVLRVKPDFARHWFAEIGVGANVILPLYRSRDKQFSTEFNFGDHLAIGRQFGTHDNQEIALRLQHFSNGGIDHPNPGENFIQLRYSHRL